MKYLEGINDTKLEISNIMLDCEDIMLELKDMGAQILVEKTYKDYDLIITCCISCNKKLYVKIKDDIYESLERLTHYMDSKGFQKNDSYIDRQVGYFQISFIKINMDKDYIGHLRYLKRYNIKENYSSTFTPEEILRELSMNLIDNGLYIDFPNDNKFGGKFYLEITDRDKRYCKNYPIDDMDWLYGKKVISDFIEELDDFGLVRGNDYLVYGGGTGVNIVFPNKNKIKL